MSKYIPPHLRGKPDGQKGLDEGEKMIVASTKNAGAMTEDCLQQRLQNPSWRASKRVYDKLFNPDLMKPKPDNRPVGDLLKSLAISDLDENEATGIENCRHLASYSFTGSRQMATMVIPGVPPAWIGPPQHRVTWDSKACFRDLNAAYSPDFAMQRTVQAIFEMSDVLHWRNLDIVTCSHVLVNLLKFAEGVDWTFRFDVGIVGETVFFIRRELTPTETIDDMMGYGQNFNKDSTVLPHELKDTTAHCRVVQYEFGGLDIALRSNIDGFIPTASVPENISTPITSNKRTQHFLIKFGGVVVPQSDLFDSKTRSNRHLKPPNVVESTRRLWAKQIPHYVVGIHDRGQFQNVSIENMHDSILQWEKNNARALNRLSSALREIIKASIDFRSGGESGNLEVVRVGEGPLEIRRQYGEEREVLPKRMMAQWTGQGHG